MEAIGMALSHYQYYSACDIIDINHSKGGNVYAKVYDWPLAH